MRLVERISSRVRRGGRLSDELTLIMVDLARRFDRLERRIEEVKESVGGGWTC